MKLFLAAVLSFLTFTSAAAGRLECSVSGPSLVVAGESAGYTGMATGGRTPYTYRFGLDFIEVDGSGYIWSNEVYAVEISGVASGVVLADLPFEVPGWYAVSMRVTDDRGKTCSAGINPVTAQ